MVEKIQWSQCAAAKGLVQYVNCKLLRDSRFVDDHLWVENGRVVDPATAFFEHKRMAHFQVDCEGLIVSPGFIDVQINGGFGIDLSKDTPKAAENLQFLAKKLLSSGVVAFCPTIISSNKDFYRKILPMLKKSKGGSHGAEVLGLHLEGPFISVEKKGAHPVQHLIDGFENGFDDITDVYGPDLGDVAYITVAPELKNCNAVIRELVSKGIRVSLGHSVASLETAEEAILAGASGVTHLFNAMSPFHHRDPGLIGVLTSRKVSDRHPLHYGIIADGVHTDDAAICIAYRTNSSGLMLVTDAVPALGYGDGVHQMGDITVEIRGHRAVLLGTDTLVGSICSLDKCVQRLLNVTKCSQEQALECTTLHPAEFLGITDRKGTLDVGKEADFVMLDDQLSVAATFIGGRNVYMNEALWKRRGSCLPNFV